MAEFVELNPRLELDDIGTFNLHRSRIPTDLFRSIVEDMDVLLAQYGPLRAQNNEEARSRFLSPIFNRLIAQFNFAFRNLPETIIEGRISTRGRIKHYFKAFGSISVLFIEVKFKIGNDADRLDAIAQVIAECDVCDRNNAAKGFDMPIIGILCDGMSFEFFSFDGKTRKFTRGCLPGDPAEYRCGLRLTDFTLDGPGRFIAGLRQICEIIFDLFMGAYISSLTSFRERSEWKGKKDGNPRKSLDEWDEALKHAQKAFGKFRAAETKRKGKDGERANTLVEEALYALELSIQSLTIRRTNFIMTGWDDLKVEEV
ncbi:hypothetical protein K443DRAFT_301106 [Laccaria amethystina LaAM-08-1]|uniref:Uncharacterized protein n=1 Tax=Laccaria amethystina LaAM-08-1 TaxID=1095629 RepID=A0A0C9YHE7_9AGAR|nr:hypothetical protein K443DRAFT_301106 [Laccaria amethystina LaAM-08-1]